MIPCPSKKFHCKKWTKCDLHTLQKGIIVKRSHQDDPMTEPEVLAAAAKIIKTHGESAAIEAALMADKMLIRADVIGHDNWKRITLAIRLLHQGHDDAG